MEEDLLKGKTLLVVDDEVDLRDIMASELEFMGAQVFQAGNISAAKDILKNGTIDLIVSDIRMPGGTGIDLLDFVKAQNPVNPPVVLITGFADITVEDAFNKGAEALLSKPFKLDDLIKVVERHTRPLNQRYTEPDFPTEQDLYLKFDDNLETLMKGRSVLIGRGGVSLVLAGQRKKIETGESVKFDLEFRDKYLKGKGVCRWVKVLDGQKTTLGLEFVHLEPESLDYFQSYAEKNVGVTFIPIP